VDQRKLIILISGAVAVLVLSVTVFWFVRARWERSIPIQSRTTTLSDSIPKTTAIEIPPASISIPEAPKAKTVPQDRDQEMAEYWLSRINQVRRQKNLRELVPDQRLANTAHDWAVSMGTRGVINHDRPEGKTVHEWVAPYQLTFTERSSDGGWRGNFFSENIGRAYADETTESYHHALDQVLADMLSEGPDGDHVRTIVSTDWNSLGSGFYFEPISPGRVRVYMAFHYASLVSAKTN